jgi:hypothetical protein
MTPSFLPLASRVFIAGLVVSLPVTQAPANLAGTGESERAGAAYGELVADTIVSRIKCTGCRIDSKLVVTLKPEGEHAPNYFTPVRRASDGRYLVGDITFTKVLVYAANGRLESTIGRSGRGPGEFARIGMLALDSHDTLFVYDETLGRISVFGPDGTFARQLAAGFGQVFGMVSLGDTGLVLAPLAPPHALLLLDTRDRTVRDLEPVRTDRKGDRRLGPTSRGAIWSAEAKRYVFRKIAPSGRVLEQHVRRADWFNAKPEGNVPPGQKPASVIQTILEDRDGRLWTAISTARPNWKGSPPARKVSARAKHAVSGLYSDRLQTQNVIEVIDPRSRQLLASLTLGSIGEFIAEGFISVTRVSEDDVAEFDIYSVSFRK